MLRRSLWIDFLCWCLQQKIVAEQMPQQVEFYETLDKFFVRKSDTYEFPALEICQKAFSTNGVLP